MEKLLTIDEAARLSRMSVAWWRQRVFRREVQFLKIGRSVRIPQSALDEILAKALVKPRELPARE